MPSELLSSIMGGGGGNNRPVLEYVGDFPQPKSEPFRTNRLPGFDGNGDYIVLPTTSAA
jgi:hypothetical protein